MSLLSWERGLKSLINPTQNKPKKVAPLVGAWIEIPNIVYQRKNIKVAPLVGAWIEMFIAFTSCKNPLSRSSRGSVD